MIDEKIIVKVLKIEGKQVQLGIIAPKSIVVERKELVEKFKDKKES